LADSILQARYFDSLAKWEWYVIEFDGDATFFGLIVTASVAVVGQFTLDELESTVGSGQGAEETSVRLDGQFKVQTLMELAKEVPSVKVLLREVEERGGRKNEGLVQLDTQ
jgi:hypothetical protein